MSRHRRNPESGFALLLVFAMAAIVAITLYTQLPSVAFEAQRDKEDLLMTRGHEYSRAIMLYVHKFNRFPATMDDLENTNNVRFLRRRYADPMTGKTDWRLLHAGPGGVITDSIVNNKKDAPATQQNFVTELQMFGAAPVGQDDGVNLATRKRASDQPGAPGDPSMPGGGNLSNGGNANLNLSPAGPASGNSGYNGPVMVLPDGSIVPANATGTAPQPGTPPAGGLPGMPGAAGMPGAPGAIGFSGGMPLQPNPISQNGQNTPPLPSQLAPPNGAASLINQILTSPRPGGINGLAGTPGAASAATTATTSTPGGTTATPAGPMGVGAGVAGVASKREQEGIKTYNQRKKYNEWEFIYDISKDPTKTLQGATGAAGASGAQGASGSTSPSPVPAPASNGLGPGGANLPTNPMAPGSPTMPTSPMAPTPPSQ